MNQPGSSSQLFTTEERVTAAGSPPSLTRDSLAKPILTKVLYVANYGDFNWADEGQVPLPSLQPPSTSSEGLQPPSLQSHPLQNVLPPEYSLADFDTLEALEDVDPEEALFWLRPDIPQVKQQVPSQFDLAYAAMPPAVTPSMPAALLYALHTPLLHTSSSSAPLAFSNTMTTPHADAAALLTCPPPVQGSLFRPVDLAQPNTRMSLASDCRLSLKRTFEYEERAGFGSTMFQHSLNIQTAEQQEESRLGRGTQVLRLDTQPLLSEKQARERKLQQVQSGKKAHTAWRAGNGAQPAVVPLSVPVERSEKPLPSARVEASEDVIMSEAPMDLRSARLARRTELAARKPAAQGTSPAGPTRPLNKNKRGAGPDAVVRQTRQQRADIKAVPSPSQPDSIAAAPVTPDTKISVHKSWILPEGTPQWILDWAPLPPASKRPVTGPAQLAHSDCPSGFTRPCLSQQQQQQQQQSVHAPAALTAPPALQSVQAKVSGGWAKTSGGLAAMLTNQHDQQEVTLNAYLASHLDLDPQSRFDLLRHLNTKHNQDWNNLTHDPDFKLLLQQEQLGTTHTEAQKLAQRHRESRTESLKSLRAAKTTLREVKAQQRLDGWVSNTMQRQHTQPSPDYVTFLQQESSQPPSEQRNLQSRKDLSFKQPTRTSRLATVTLDRTQQSAGSSVPHTQTLHVRAPPRKTVLMMLQTHLHTQKHKDLLLSHQVQPDVPASCEDKTNQVPFSTSNPKDGAQPTSPPATPLKQRKRGSETDTDAEVEEARGHSKQRLDGHVIQGTTGNSPRL